MSEQVVSCRPGADADEIGGLMSEHRVRRVVVVDEHDKPVGIVSLGDLAVSDEPSLEASEVLGEISG
jgi:CBS domain-containing protein